MPSRHPANWNEHLTSFNTDRIWKELNRIVGQHKLSRYSTKFDQLVDEGKFTRYTDLTQELFVTLLEKDRFKHYINTEMSDADIEMEISQIELTNILTQELRKRYPESYRISRRVLQILQQNDKFKRLQEHGHKRVSDHMYGLTEWNFLEKGRFLSDDEPGMAYVPYHTRDNRHVGCSGDSQIIISNIELENLITTIFVAVDSPMSVKQLRKYVMSRLTIMDINLTPIESYVDEDDKQTFEPVDQAFTPEQTFLKNAAEEYAESKVDEFLELVWVASKEKQKQYNLMLSILEHYYLTPLSQWDVSRQLGVSDSLISGYRKTLDALLQNLGFTTIEEARKFQSALLRTLKKNKE